MTNGPTSLAHPAPQNGARLTTLNPAGGYITIINTYTVAPERAEARLDLLVRATAETIRYMPGFVSASFHINLDRTQAVNYAQWQSREAIAAAGAHPKVAAHTRGRPDRGWFHADAL
jgi:quinol monooxygenase YgiN